MTCKHIAVAVLELHCLFTMKKEREGKDLLKVEVFKAHRGCFSRITQQGRGAHVKQITGTQLSWLGFTPLALQC